MGQTPSLSGYIGRRSQKQRRCLQYLFDSIKMDQLGQKFKINFLLFLKWWIIQLNLGAKNLKSDIASSRQIIWQSASCSPIMTRRMEQSGIIQIGPDVRNLCHPLIASASQIRHSNGTRRECLLNLDSTGSSTRDLLHHSQRPYPLHHHTC